MASSSKKTLNKENLMRLGAEELAELCLQISKGNAGSQRVLRTAIAGSLGVEEAIREIRKRMTSIARSKTYLDYVKKKILTKDIETLRDQILKQILPRHPEESVDLLWRLMRLSNGIIMRLGGDASALFLFFKNLTRDLNHCATKAKINPEALAERIIEDLQDNGYGQYDYLIENMFEALGQEGLEALKEKSLSLSDSHEDNYVKQHALKVIADRQDDIDGYIALFSDEDLKKHRIAADVAFKLLRVGRAQDAWDRVENAKNSAVEHYDTAKYYNKVKADILTALNKKDDAQNVRYAFFEKTLSRDFLKDYLQNVDEFEDFKEEQKALKFVLTYSDIHIAMDFFAEWHAPRYLNDLILKRYEEVDGDHFDILPNVAKILSAEYYLAATLVLRALITDTLEGAKHRRYKYGVQHLEECASLAKYITNYQGHPSHEDYVEMLYKKHSRKQAFWFYVR